MIAGAVPLRMVIPPTLIAAPNAAGVVRLLAPARRVSGREQEMRRLVTRRKGENQRPSGLSVREGG
jgi:hypothetical protein